MSLDPSAPVNATTAPLRVVVATSNPGKVTEIREALSGLGWDLLALDDASLPTITLPEETGTTYEENAALKACAAALQSGLPALADDSGLEVSALNGDPGVFSARFGNLDSATARNVHLLEQLRGKKDRAAKFVSVLLLAYPDGHLESYRGEVAGEILEGPRGEAGFGYDPLFLLPDGRSMAELSVQEKRAVSHRGRALEALKAAHAAGAPEREVSRLE
ncbi:RdgB/HAM1 family non-canonical purine NTP pyrophosphatase [Deinococcus aquiradiocola]|nr:RdgB/HAM1 family non-canonical purine NTP pyrophosphatase [Deinococcus aquiradiocola]